MAEMEDALRSCMEQLLIAREEREQIIVEAAAEISSQQKKLRDLQHSLEAANKKAAKLAAENNSLCKAIDAKDKLVRELRESKAASDQELSGATAKLDAAQKQSASLQYEARMLQKELEVRSQEREYDLKSVDAARAQQAESLKKIAQLEGECQRLRAMVRKRLPGPAALAKMRDEVEQQQPPPPSRAGASPRRPRSVTPTMSPRSVTPRRAPEPDQSYAVRLRAIEDENNVLKRMLATRDTELQFAQTKYAEEASKLSAVQGQLKQSTEESKRLSDAHAKSESWASALVSELEHFRDGKLGQGASSVMVSEMSLLDDFAEIERLEMASGDHQASGHSGSVVPEKNAESQVLEHGHPEWLQDVWKLVTSNHEATGDSIDSILDGIRRALDEGPVHGNGDASDLPYNRTKVEKLIANLIEKITSTIRVSAEDGAARSGSLLHAKPEFCARLEYLVHVCHDVLQRKAKLENFIDEVCLVLEYIMSQYFLNQVRSDTVDDNENDFDGGESISTANAHGETDMQSATSAAALDIQTEAQKDQIQSREGQHPDKIQERQLNKELAVVMLDQDDDIQPGRKSSYYEIERQLNEELAMVMLDQNDNIQPGRKSSYYETESLTADGMGEVLAQKEGKQLATNSEISAAADKLAECQETITNLSKQLQALQTVPNSGTPDISTHSPRPSSADYKPPSLGSILADEGASTTEGHSSPKKEHDEPDDAAARKSTAQEQNPDANGKASAKTVVQPLFPEHETAADPRKKQRGPSLLGRMIFRKRVEGSSS